MKLSGFLNSFALLLLLANMPFNSANWAVDDDGCRTPNGGVGNCMSIRSCLPIMDVLMNTRSIDERTKKYLKGFQCGYDGVGPKVCCPSSPIKFGKGRTKENARKTTGNIRRLTPQPQPNPVAENYDCKTMTQDIGKCVPLESCNYVAGIISKVKGNYESQRSKGRDFFLKTDQLNTRKAWCEHVGVAGGNVGRDKCKSAEIFSYGLNLFQKFDLKAVLESYKCNEDKVCCPFAPADPQFHPNLNLLESNCALETIVPYKPRRRLLSRGENATLLEYPWMASLKYSGRKYLNNCIDLKEVGSVANAFSRTREFHCAASLINKRYLLTAAHCIKPNKLKLIGARLGEFDFNQKVDCEGSVCAPEVQDFEVTPEDAIVHPDYETLTYHNDIALIRLRKDVEFSFAVQPICLPIKFLARANNFKKRVIVTGWGLTETGIPSSTLLEINIPVISPENCSKFYGKSIDIIDKQFCAGGGGQDSCKGDSGGPLMDVMVLNLERAVVQYGIVSFGLRQKCGKRNSPSVYTKVTSYLNWILDNLKP